MESPQEIEVWYVLPALRRALSEEMLKLGLKQKDIAARLHVTAAAVSQYLKSKRANELSFPASIKKAVQSSAKKVAKDSNPNAEIQRLCRIIRAEGLLCKLHRKHSDLELKSCNVCGK